MVPHMSLEPLLSFWLPPLTGHSACKPYTVHAWRGGGVCKYSSTNDVKYKRKHVRMDYKARLTVPYIVHKMYGVL